MIRKKLKPTLHHIFNFVKYSIVLKTHSRAHTVDFIKEGNDQAVEIAQV